LERQVRVGGKCRGEEKGFKGSFVVLHRNAYKKPGTGERKFRFVTGACKRWGVYSLKAHFDRGKEKREVWGVENEGYCKLQPRGVERCEKKKIGTRGGY